MMYLDLAHDFCILLLCFFFFNDTATTEIYTLSLHDALPSCSSTRSATPPAARPTGACSWPIWSSSADRKSTRLTFSHITSSYAVFCLKKKTILHCRVASTCPATTCGISRCRCCAIAFRPASLRCLKDTATTEIYTLSRRDCRPI